MPGQQDHVDIPEQILGADGAAQLDAVHLRHLPVGDNQSARAAAKNRQCLVAVRRRHDFVAALDQSVPQDGQGNLVVVNDQYSHLISFRNSVRLRAFFAIAARAVGR